MISAIGRNMTPIVQPMASPQESLPPQAVAAPPQTDASIEQVFDVLESQGETAQAAARVQVTMFRASMDMARSMAMQMISMAGAVNAYNSGSVQPALASGSTLSETA